MNGSIDGYVLRHVFKFMAYMGIDPKWEEYSQYPDIFKFSETETHE